MEQTSPQVAEAPAGGRGGRGAAAAAAARRVTPDLSAHRQPQVLQHGGLRKQSDALANIVVQGWWFSSLCNDTQVYREILYVRSVPTIIPF